MRLQAETRGNVGQALAQQLCMALQADEASPDLAALGPLIGQLHHASLTGDYLQWAVLILCTCTPDTHMLCCLACCLFCRYVHLATGACTGKKRRVLRHHRLTNKRHSFTDLKYKSHILAVRR